MPSRPSREGAACSERRGGDGDDALDHVPDDGERGESLGAAEQVLACLGGRGHESTVGRIVGGWPVGSAAGAVGDGGAAEPAGALGAVAAGFHRGVLSAVAGAGQVEQGEQGERVAQAGVGELVADAASLGGGGDQAAVAQAGEVIGEVGAAGAEVVGELGRVGRPAEELHEDAPPCGVGEGGAHPVEHMKAAAEAALSTASRDPLARLDPCRLADRDARQRVTETSNAKSSGPPAGPAP